jgi:hypothetical protein
VAGEALATLVVNKLRGIIQVAARPNARLPVCSSSSSSSSSSAPPGFALPVGAGAAAAAQ